MVLKPYLLPEGFVAIRFKILVYYRVRSVFESNPVAPSNKI